ncbi:DUF4365 domain-containing protein [Rhizobium binxianense]
MAAVEKIFVRDFKWSFRHLPDARIGIDARAEILNGGWPTGRFLPLQIRPMPSLTENRGYLHRGEKDHLDYWTKHALSVCVILADPGSGLMLWQLVEKGSCTEAAGKWSIVVSADNTLNASARLCFEEAMPSDPESLMRSAFALDRQLMEKVRDETTSFVWDERSDTTAIFSNLRIYFGESPEEEPDEQINYHLRAHNLHEVMTRLFPWASYSYAEPIREYSEEVAVHVLEVDLRPEAYAYLDAEEFLEAGYPDEEEPYAPESGG